MILEIRLSNFWSVKDEVVLDMRAANIKSQNAQLLSDNTFSFAKTEVLKTATIYGANASGKSNIVKAIRFSCMMVLHSHNHNANDTFNFKKFKFGSSEGKPSSFFMRFAIEGIEYEYAFSLMQDRILSESLHYYPNGRITKIFDRKEKAGKSKKEKYSFGKVLTRPMDVAENTSEKTLFLSRASQMDRDVAKLVFNYFSQTFVLSYLGHNALQIEALFDRYKPQLLEALQIADSDIVDIRLKKIRRQGKNVSVNISTQQVSLEDVMQDALSIRTFHKTDPSKSFDLLQEESEGTKKLFVIMLSILDVVANNKVLLIDEIGESLHTDIIEYIFNIFRASKQAQLICTTHNTRFLDLRKFRKDQFYFVNKKDDASSDLYSLYDYSDFRDTMDLEKAYLQGRFDAVPFVDDSMANLKHLING